MCALVACALVPSAAQAARPGTLVAVGQAPTVAVDANGTGYVAYNDQPPGRDDQPVGLCVVAPGASRCSSNRDVLVDGNSGEAVPPLISATGSGHLTLAAGRCCGIDNVEMVSNDAGSTFTAPETIGSLIYFDGAIGPAGQALFVDGDTLNGVQAQVGSPGSPADLTATLMSSVAVHAPAAWAGSTPVVVGGGHSTIAASYSGSGDPNDGANWNNVRVPGASYAPSLASGPTGLFLLQDTGLIDGRLTIRRFEGSRFGPRA